MGDAGKGLWQLRSVSLTVSERAGPGPWFPTLGLTSGSPRELSTPGQVQVSQTSGGGSLATPGMVLPLEPLLAPMWSPGSGMAIRPAGSGGLRGLESPLQETGGRRGLVAGRAGTGRLQKRSPAG